MTTLMYDGVNSLAPGIARQFPHAAKVAGYLNGRYAWSHSDWALFPNADHVTITVSASLNAGDVLDVEAGDAMPAEAAMWIRARKASGLHRPTVYCSRSVIPDVRVGTGRFVLGADYDIWVADYTGQPHQVAAPGMPAASCAATQYSAANAYDVSAVYDPGWPHRLPPGLPAPSGLSGTPHATGNFEVAPVPGATGYRWQVAAGPASHPGGIYHEQVTTGVHALQVPVPMGPCCWRAQALPGGSWSGWRALEG